MSLNQDCRQDGFELECLELECLERWVVFRRLQELGIPCSCGYYQPLRVSVHSAEVLIQVWFVLKRVKASRSNLIRHLENCWQNFRLLNEEPG